MDYDTEHLDPQLCQVREWRHKIQKAFLGRNGISKADSQVRRASLPPVWVVFESSEYFLIADKRNGRYVSAAGIVQWNDGRTIIG